MNCYFNSFVFRIVWATLVVDDNGFLNLISLNCPIGTRHLLWCSQCSDIGGQHVIDTQIGVKFFTYQFVHPLPLYLFGFLFLSICLVLHKNVFFLENLCLVWGHSFLSRQLQVETNKFSTMSPISSTNKLVSFSMKDMSTFQLRLVTS